MQCVYLDPHNKIGEEKRRREKEEGKSKKRRGE